MSWPVFAGDYHEIGLALLQERCLQDGQPLTDLALARWLRLHLHRASATWPQPGPSTPSPT